MHHSPKQKYCILHQDQNPSAARAASFQLLLALTGPALALTQSLMCHIKTTSVLLPIAPSLSCYFIHSSLKCNHSCNLCAYLSWSMNFVVLFCIPSFASLRQIPFMCSKFNSYTYTPTLYILALSLPLMFSTNNTVFYGSVAQICGSGQLAANTN